MEGTPKRVLIIEDHPDTRDVFRTVLEHRGFDVAEAEDGVLGLEALREDPPDLVILDLGLPKLDGWGVATEARADPDIAGVPILLVTAFADPEAVRRARSLGLEHFLRKPLNPMVLVRTVEEMLEPGELDTGT